MIRVIPAPEPDYFDREVRQKGLQWLKNPTNDGKRPKEYWQACYDDLRNAFACLCGYGAMWLPEGTVDHYLSCANHRNKAYEWSNYRFASQRINSSKGKKDGKVLDPFEVDDEWFAILLPSLQLVLTQKVPSEVLDRAQYTLAVLKLGDDMRIVEQRAAWYELHKSGDLTLAGLKEKAPLIARAVEKWRNEHPGEPLP